MSGAFKTQISCNLADTEGFLHSESRHLQISNHHTIHETGTSSPAFPLSSVSIRHLKIPTQSPLSHGRGFRSQGLKHDLGITWAFQKGILRAREFPSQELLKKSSLTQHVFIVLFLLTFFVRQHLQAPIIAEVLLPLGNQRYLGIELAFQLGHTG